MPESRLIVPRGLAADTEWAVRAAGVWTMNPDDLFVSDAVIRCQGDRVVEVYSASACPTLPEAVVELEDEWICPALVNAHVHLELGHVAGKTRQGGGFTDWVSSLVPHLRNEPEAGLKKSIADVSTTGTVFFGDITSRHPALVRTVLEERGLDCLHFFEVIGNSDRIHWLPALEDIPGGRDGKHVSTAGHALYSTSPELLRLAKEWASEQSKPYSLHLAETRGEVELTKRGEGELADFFKKHKMLPQDYKAPGLSPVAWAAEFGLLDSATLAVHCVHVDDADIRLLEESGATVALCPRSNEYIGVGRAPWERYFQSSIPVCLATDGLSSNHDLDLWNELQWIVERADTRVSPCSWLEMVTVNPASILGVSGFYGSIEAGKRAAFSRVPRWFRERFNQSLGKHLIS